MLEEHRLKGMWVASHSHGRSPRVLREPARGGRRRGDPLVFEAGKLAGRIAYDRRNKIVGMLILSRPESDAVTVVG